MTRTDFQILTFKKANVTPTARASILVAIAKINMVLKLLNFDDDNDDDDDDDNDDDDDDDDDNDNDDDDNDDDDDDDDSPAASLIILTPMIVSNPKAIQWSICVINCSN